MGKFYYITKCTLEDFINNLEEASSRLMPNEPLQQAQKSTFSTNEDIDAMYQATYDKYESFVGFVRCKRA